MCRVLGVSSAGFYRFLGRPVSKRAEANASLLGEISKVHAEHRGLIGSPTVYSLLQERGICGSRGRVCRLMRASGIRGRGPTSFVMTTVHAGGAYSASPNHLKRNFSAGGQEALVADITYLPTKEGNVYLAVVISLRTRRVLGHSMAAQLHGNLGLDALRSALTSYPQAPGTILHSDRGGHYVSHAYRALVAEHQLVQSMSRPNNCWDNAVAESFFATLKRELASPALPATRQTVYEIVFEYIEVYYNRRRPHSTLGHKTPEEYARLLAKAI
jgi:transposase InsO family protein